MNRRLRRSLPLSRNLASFIIMRTVRFDLLTNEPSQKTYLVVLLQVKLDCYSLKKNVFIIFILLTILIEVAFRKNQPSNMQYCIAKKTFKIIMREQSMELHANTLSNSSYGVRSQRSKNKLQSKQPNNEFKLHKQSSQTKLDKRHSGGQYQNQQIQIEKVFRLHARSTIQEEQALFSLKLLGYVCQSGEDYARFLKIWAKYGSFIDEENFKSLVAEVKNKGQMRDHSSSFNILTQGKMVFDQKRLVLIGEELGKDITGIIEYCGKDGIIDFSQFDSIMKFTNALT